MQRRERPTSLARDALNSASFEAISEEYLHKVKRERRAEATLAKKRWLIGIANSSIGKRPISEISAAEILVPLRRVEDAGNYKSARRLRAVIGQVFRYAIATARAVNDPTFGLRGALIAPTVTHRAALTNRLLRWPAADNLELRRRTADPRSFAIDGPAVSASWRASTG